MNSTVAKGRIAYVARPDSITYADGDFLATHVALKRLNLLDTFVEKPEISEYYDEEEIFQQYICNPEDKHQFIAVYGQSGTGKSHLIRWFAAKYDNYKSDNEVVLFIRRSDNTLKGTIKQLLNKPEVSNIANKEIYERLVKASATIEEKKLKDLIYHNFIIEVENDDGEKEIKISNVRRKKLIAFLNNENVKDYLMEGNGPVERFYSKIAEHSAVDRDTVAQFNKNDFLISQDLYEKIQISGADKKAQSFALSLLADSDGITIAEETVAYLNQFRNDVIQRCAGIEPGDFKQVFLDIRRELHKIDKKLTIFIEDITSFTGVDNALLDALIEEHTGMTIGEELCRVSSIVGATDYYLQHHFKANHKDRVSKYIYLPSNVLDENGLYEFVGRYLNAMSLTESEIENWMTQKASPEDYPVHEVVEGKFWDDVEIDYNKTLNLYPFTKRSIRRLYNSILKKDHQTPRYIITNIIEPVVNEALYNLSSFPSIGVNLNSEGTKLNKKIEDQFGDDNKLKSRLMTFLNVWGNGKPEQYDKDGIQYVCGIRRELLEAISLPVPDFDRVVPVETEGNNKGINTEDITHGESVDAQIPEEKLTKNRIAAELLNTWINEKRIDISSSGGASGIVHKAVYDDITSYIYSAINWQAEGISMDNADKVKDSKALYVILEGQTKGEGLLTLTAEWTSIDIIMAFVRWNVYGGKSWDYPGSEYDMFSVTTWIEKIKPEIIKAVREYKEGRETKYIEAAVASEIYRMILNGEYTENNLKKFNEEKLLSKKVAKNESNSHCKEWNGLLTFIFQQDNAGKNNDTVRQYYNIVQGKKGGSKFVLDSSSLSKTLNSVKQKRLFIEKEEIQIDDKVKQRREVYQYYDSIQEKASIVAKAELESGKEIVSKIYGIFGDDDIDGAFFEELINRINVFNQGADNTQINVKEISLAPLKTAKQMAKAVSDINSVSEADDALSILMAFSSDPIGVLKPFVSAMDLIEKEVNKAKEIVKQRNEQLGADIDANAYHERYDAAKMMISESIKILEGMVE